MLWDFDKYPKIEAALDHNGYLILRQAGPNAVAANTFTKDRIPLLWEKIIAAKLPASSASITLFSGVDETRDRYIAEPAAILNSNGNNKAYEAFQLERFEATHMEMRVNYAKPQLCLMAVKKAGSAKQTKKPVAVLVLPTLKGETEAPQTTAPKRGKLNLG